MSDMKRKWIALLTLLVFVSSMVGSGLAAVAAPVSDGKSYTAYDSTPALPSTVTPVALAVNWLRYSLSEPPPII